MTWDWRTADQRSQIM